jgi:hypothetical protein
MTKWLIAEVSILVLSVILPAVKKLDSFKNARFFALLNLTFPGKTRFGNVMQ